MKEIMNFLNGVEQSRAATNLAVASLAEADVITQWPLKIQERDQEKPVTGLYRIDEARFNSLEDDKFLKIRKAGALPIAYAQLLSMGNIQNFAQLAKAQEQMKSKSPESDIKPVLGDDDIISSQKLGGYAIWKGRYKELKTRGLLMRTVLWPWVCRMRWL